MVGRYTVTFLAAAMSIASPLIAKPFTGTFWADGRPSWMAFLSLTQTEHGVTGFLVTAEPDSRGSTSSRSVAVEGSSDHDAFTLQTQTFLNLGSGTLTGRLSGRRLVLSTLGSSGRIESFVFARSSEESFNLALSAWHRDLKSTYLKKKAKEEVAEARAAKAANARGAANRLREVGEDLASATDNLHESASLTSQLSAVENALKVVEESVERIKSEPTSNCSHLRDEASYVYDQVQYLRSARAYFEEGVKRVEEQIADVQSGRDIVARQLSGFRTAVADDPTGAVPATDVKAFSEITPKLLDASARESSRAISMVRDARGSADSLVRKGATAYNGLADSVNAACGNQ